MMHGAWSGKGTYAGLEFVDDILQALVESICGYLYCALFREESVRVNAVSAALQRTQGTYLD